MTEEERLNFLVNRDGYEAARKWAEQTLALYRQAAIERSLYWSSIKEIEAWLKKPCI